MIKLLSRIRPVPISRWEGTRRATRYGYVCPQPDVYAQIESNEDCLTLNIFTPYEADNNSTYPVMVYIHGGSYRVGTGASYMGGPLAQHGVVVVTINYRLCVLGFLSARNDILPGNNGLLDQIEALKWVNKNIAFFRGDPEQVTIFGNSAGGASVGLLTVSPPAKGLFQQSIIQSGSPFSFWALHNDTVDLVAHTRKLAEMLNCHQEDFTELVECLRTVPAEDMAQKCYTAPSISVSNTNFRPHIDNYVLPKDIYQLYNLGEINSQRVMTGIVEREWSRHVGMMISELWRTPGFDTHIHDGLARKSFEDAIRDIFEKQFGWGKSVADVVLYKYTDWANKDDPEGNREQYITFMSDFGMLAPTVEVATYIAQHGIPVYAYQFNHRSSKDPHSWSSNAHLMELYYIFGAPFLKYDVVQGYKKEFSDIDAKMSRYMMTLWSDFAKTGQPSINEDSGSNEWIQFDPYNSYYLAISDNDTSMKTDLGLNPDGVCFWNELIPSMTRMARNNSGGTGVCILGSTQSAQGANVLAWILGVLCIVLAIVVVSLAVLYHRARLSSRSSRKL